jgi:hypothetical protein
MSKLVLAGGKHDEYGDSLKLNYAFAGEVMEGLTVEASTGMNVKVMPGKARVPTGTGLGSFYWPIAVDTSGGEVLAVSTADGSNPRWDLVVAYIISANNNTTATNNPTSLGLAVVAGTPASSPSDPTTSAIQAAIGGSRPFIIMARLVVPAGATQASSFTYVDRRTMMGPIIPNGFITASMMLNGFMEYRQGGHATNWAVAGTTDYPTHNLNIRLLPGVIPTSTTGDVPVTFARPFTQKPIVLVSVSGGNSGDTPLTQNAWALENTVTVDGFTARTVNDSGGASNQAASWLAIGI